MSTLPAPPASDADRPPILPAVSVEWIDNGTIVVFTIRNVTRSSVDVWVKLLNEALASWPENRPFLSFYDLGYPDAAFTPYLRTKIGEVMDKHLNLAGRTAIVVRKTFLMTLAQLFLRNRKTGTRQRRIFFDDRDETRRKPPSFSPCG